VAAPVPGVRGRSSNPAVVFTARVGIYVLIALTVFLVVTLISSLALNF
jgi:hypothetical protein